MTGLGACQAKEALSHFPEPVRGVTELKESPRQATISSSDWFFGASDALGNWVGGRWAILETGTAGDVGFRGPRGQDVH